jgi:crotonobetainyl-CoA:carnitine CoA-transferase CaiB-like acyl-CoA transferase
LADKNELPLKGLRVLDFGHYLAGPMVGMILADQGAQVIRIDPPTGPRWKNHANAILGRGKKSIVLDLKTAQGCKIAQDLAARSDLL